MRNKLLYLTIYFILADLVITVLFWHLEANPIVINMGLEVFTLLKILLSIGVVFVYNLMRDSYYIRRLCLIPALLIHFVIVIQNIVVVML